MTVRKRKKKHRMRGNRTHGGGNTKNRRGSGVRGGRGRAGGHKHKFSTYMHDFGVKKRLKPKTLKQKALNLEELERRIPEWIEEKKASREANGVIIDGKKTGFFKILSEGSINEKIILKNLKASKKAAEKIQKAGGMVESKEKQKKKETKQAGEKEKPMEKAAEEKIKEKGEKQ
nr:50S ribosomal protein L15P [uncultured archaeon]